jgi:hypothetical protein
LHTVGLPVTTMPRPARLARLHAGSTQPAFGSVGTRSSYSTVTGRFVIGFERKMRPVPVIKSSPRTSS